MNCAHCDEPIYYATGGRDHAWLHVDTHEPRCQRFAEPERKPRQRRADDPPPPPRHATGYDREVLVDVLVYHQRKDITCCACGWAELGCSHAEHVADVYEASVVARSGTS